VHFYAGFKVWDVGCCPVGKYGQCDPDQQENICKNRSEYLFWDSFHPTEIVNNILAARAYKAFEKFDTYPTDISHLAKI
jgi:phospholipase/lecithinase/hemolysin